MSEIQGLTALQRRFAAISDGRQMLGQIGLLAVREAKALVPRQTGNLGRSIRLGTVTESNAQIIAGGAGGVGYARFIEEGTGLYGPRKRRIVPTTKKALAFHSQAAGAERFGIKYRLSGTMTSASARKWGPGADFVVVRSVKGRRATPYLLPGAKAAVSKAGLAERVITAWNEAS